MFNDPSASFGVMNSIIPLFFLIVIGIIIFQVIKGIGQWASNNNQPVLTVRSHIVSKRTKVSNNSHAHGNGHHHSSTSTTYFVSFEVESGDRMELQVTGTDYGQLAEGDVGELTFQGTRYKGFNRIAKVH